MGIVEAIGAFLKLLGIVAVPLIERMKAKDENTKHFLDAVSDGVKDSANSIDISDQIDAADKLADDALNGVHTNP